MDKPIEEMNLEEQKAFLTEHGTPGGRKLNFRQQCSAFAALYAGVSNLVVARTFGISPQTVSKLSGCLEYDPEPHKLAYAIGSIDDGRRNPGRHHPQHNPDLEMPISVMMDHNRNRQDVRVRHYGEVGREFIALGVEEFNNRYYTPALIKHLVIAKEELRKERIARRMVRK